MKLSEKQHELIQMYLSGILNVRDTELFNTYKDLPEFKEELLFQARMIDSLDVMDEALVREELTNAESSMKIESESSNEKSNNSRKLVLAFLMPLILLIGIWFLSDQYIMPKTNPDLKEIIAMHNVSYPIQEQIRGVDNRELVTEAMQAYANENYQEALRLINTITDKTEEYSLYEANCLIQLEQYNEAQNILTLLVGSNNNHTKENAQWYLAICKLGMENIEGAKLILAQIRTDSSHIFNTKAIKILSNIEN